MIRDLLVLAASLGLGAATAVWAAGSPGPQAGVQAIELRARAVPFDRDDPAATPGGRVRFLGAVELSADAPRFGGLSALTFAPRCGRLLAVSDTGNWVVLQPALRGDRLTGVSAAWIAPLLDGRGDFTDTKDLNDAESLAVTGAAAFVGYEQVHRVRRYDGIDACAPETLARPATSESPVPGTTGWGGNSGVEAMAALPDGRLIAIAEGSAGGVGGALRTGRRWFFGGASQDFIWRVPTGHSPTDAVISGDELVVLHRRFSPSAGVSAVVTAVPLASLGTEPPNPVELLRLAPPRTVDNMEGMALEQRGGRTFLWLVSDDNFNPVQRTLLMRFELLPARPPGATLRRPVATSPRSADRPEPDIR